MSIHYDSHKSQESAQQPTEQQEARAQTIRPPMQPPTPPHRRPHGKRERWFIVSALAILVVLAVVLGSFFVVQLTSSPQITPAPTTAANPTTAPTVAANPTTVSTVAANPTTASTVVSNPTTAPTIAATATSATPAGPKPPINALWMSNAMNGWASTTTHQILHTTDGGNHWQNVTPAYPAGIMSQLPPSFASLNDTVAWVAIVENQQADGNIANMLFRTTDGGRSWQNTMLPTSHLGVNQIQFVNAQDGWIMASFGGGAAGSQAVDLFRSTDGGRSWITVAHTQQGNIPGTIPFNGHKTGMSWASPTTGWISGSIATTNPVWLYRTQDGGVSWQPQSLPASTFSVVQVMPPVFFSTTEGLLPVAVHLAPVGLGVCATHDGGTTWSSPTLLATTYSAWDFLTMQQGWVVSGNASTLNKTSDGGQHWTTLTTGTNFQHIYQLHFVSEQVGWAISTAPNATPILLKTINGGQTWK